MKLDRQEMLCFTRRGRWMEKGKVLPSLKPFPTPIPAFKPAGLEATIAPSGYIYAPNHHVPKSFNLKYSP